MSVEDRLRATTEAVTESMRPVRPLTLPDDLPATARPARPRRRSWPGWRNWLIPLSAAVAVIAVAATLVVVRDLPGEQHTSASGAPNTGAATPASGGGIPRYYVALTGPSGITASEQPEAVVGDDQTGAIVLVPPPSSGQRFTGVTAAADDRTFVLASYQSATRQTIWYLLRITPGTVVPATRLTRLPIKPLAAQPTGLALSPDGRQLAVMFADADIELRTYSVSTGALLGSWHTGTPYWIPRIGGANEYGLSWLADGRRVDFRFDAYAQNSSTHLVTVRTLDVTAAGHDLLADSRLVLQTPLGDTSAGPAESCAASLAAPDGRTVICGTYRLPDQPIKASCTTTSPSFVSHSTTGKPSQVLYRYNGQCQGSLAQPLWTDSSGSQVIGLLSGDVSGTDTANVFLIAAGHFAPLSAPVGDYLSPGIADSGSIAF